MPFKLKCHGLDRFRGKPRLYGLGKSDVRFQFESSLGLRGKALLLPVGALAFLSLEFPSGAGSGDPACLPS